MHLKLLNDKIINFLENPILKSHDFDKFSKLLMDKDLVINIKELLLTHYENLSASRHETLELKIGNVEVRKFMSVFLFVYFPEIHRLEKDNKLGKDLHHVSIQLKYLLYSLCLYIRKTLISVEELEKDIKYVSGYIPVAKSFFKKLDIYLELFDRWKKYDLENLIFKMAYDFFKFEKKMEEGNELLPETKTVIKQEKKRIKEYVKKLDGEGGYQKFVEYKLLVEEYEDIDDSLARELFMQRISNLMESNLWIETWDKLEIELEDNKYNLLETLLKKVKDNIKDCVPHRTSFHLELDEIIDEKFICSQLKDGVYQIKNFKYLVDYLIQNLKELQSKRDDESTLLLEQEIRDLLDFDFQNLPFIIRFFLENINLKFDNIRRQVQYFNDMKKNNEKL